MSQSIGAFASGIYEDLGFPSGITPSYISGWLISNVGLLNVSINTEYSGISGNIYSTGCSGELITGLGQDEEAIYKGIYNINYYQRKLSESLNAAAYDTWVEIQDEGSRVKRVSKNDLAKSYTAQIKDSSANIQSLISMYRMNHAAPSQVVGDDTIEESVSLETEDYSRLY